MRYWRHKPKSWEKDDDQGIVTEADLAVDDYLHGILRSARPKYGWLSEETSDNLARLDADTVFVVDPIDGTRSFALGESAWAISIAVVRAGTPTAAVVHMPARDKTYTAALGCGAWRGDSALHASPRTEVENAAVLANRMTMNAPHWPGGVPPIRREFRSSLAYRMSLIGEGRFDAMVTFRNTWEWDIAAGTLIATEAGATVTDAHGAPLRFNTPDRHTAGVLAAGPAIHAGLLGYLR